MKVLQVIDRLEAGGAERVFLDLTKLLLDNNIQVDTMTISGKGVLFSSIDKRSNQYFLNRVRKFSIKKMLECSKICMNYDIVHVHMRHTYSYIRFAQIISGKKFKIILHDHFGDIDSNIQIPIGYDSLFKPKYYIGVSNSLTNWAQEKLNIKSNRIWLLRNTVLPNMDINKEIITKKWVVVSNIRVSKNIEFAIELAVLFDIELDIYGQYFNDSYSEKIKKMAEKYDKINIISNEYNIQKKLKKYSLAIHVAHSESGPLVLMEYLIQGLPFIAHKTGEVAEIINKELPNCFVSSLKIDDWKIKIDYLDAHLPNETTLNNLFLKYFSPEEYVKKCLEIYNEIIS